MSAGFPMTISMFGIGSDGADSAPARVTPASTRRTRTPDCDHSHCTQPASGSGRCSVAGPGQPGPARPGGESGSPRLALPPPAGIMIGGPGAASLRAWSGGRSMAGRAGAQAANFELTRNFKLNARRCRGGRGHHPMIMIMMMPVSIIRRVTVAAVTQRVRAGPLQVENAD
jgi:hypothetical protein